jgi:hypothetical protein
MQYFAITELNLSKKNELAKLFATSLFSLTYQKYYKIYFIEIYESE